MGHGPAYQNKSISARPGVVPAVCSRGVARSAWGVMGSFTHSAGHWITIMNPWLSIEFSMVASDCIRSSYREFSGRKPLSAAQCWQEPATSSAAQTRLFGHAGRLEDRS